MISLILKNHGGTCQDPKIQFTECFKRWWIHWPCCIKSEGNYFARATLTRGCFFLFFMYLFILFKEMNSVQKVCLHHD